MQTDTADHQIGIFGAIILTRLETSRLYNALAKAGSQSSLIW